MNATRMRAELRALKTRVDALVEEVERDVAAGGTIANDATAPLVRPTPKQFAEMENVSIETVYLWIRHGLPVVRRGRNYRVRLPEAHDWKMPEAIARSADKSAHRGGR